MTAKNFSFTTLPGRVVVKPLEITSHIGGLEIQDDKVSKCLGEVISVGDGCDPSIKVGTNILYSRTMGAAIQVKDNNGDAHSLCIVRSGDVDLSNVTL